MSKLAVKHILGKDYQPRVKITLGEEEAYLTIKECNAYISMLQEELLKASVEDAICNYVDTKFPDFEEDDTIRTKLSMIESFRR